MRIRIVLFFLLYISYLTSCSPSSNEDKKNEEATTSRSETILSDTLYTSSDSSTTQKKEIECTIGKTIDIDKQRAYVACIQNIAIKPNAKHSSWKDTTTAYVFTLADDIREKIKTDPQISWDYFASKENMVTSDSSTVFSSFRGLSDGYETPNVFVIWEKEEGGWYKLEWISGDISLGAWSALGSLEEIHSSVNEHLVLFGGGGEDVYDVSIAHWVNNLDTLLFHSVINYPIPTYEIDGVPFEGEMQFHEVKYDKEKRIIVVSTQLKYIVDDLKGTYQEKDLGTYLDTLFIKDLLIY